ncbi:MAG: shikimate dehydrogenase [Acutalibacteraceae bacterium]|nr:shikimate dehydrogenase [Acutalibacteraceae bacterium]
MSKKEYAVIGHPIGHTMSPFIHKRLFELAGIDADYSVIDVMPEKLDIDFNEKLSRLDGFNITIPHKSAIIPYLSQLDKKAEMYGSVNTVDKNKKGYTTDPDGFLQSLKANGIPLDGKVVIIGTGGVARTIAFEAAKAGADITIAVRPQSIHKVASLTREIMEKVEHPCVSTCYIERLAKCQSEIDLLINATPVGMYPAVDDMPVGEDIISISKAVYDVVYNPLETKLIKTAKAMGKKAVGGMDMLVWQAVVAHQIWDGSEYSLKDIEQLCKDAANKQAEMF